MKGLAIGAVLLGMACGADHGPARPPQTAERRADLNPPAPPLPPPHGVPYRHPIDRPPRPSPHGEIVRDPEVPARVIQKVAPVFTEVAIKARVQGIVVVEVVVEKDGSVSAAEVLQPLPFGLDQRAVDCVRQWRFAPARDRGVPVRSLYRATVRFERRE